MELSLNISTNPIINKTEIKKNLTKNNDSFNFKWDTNTKNTKKAFVNNKSQRNIIKINNKSQRNPKINNKNVSETNNNSTEINNDHKNIDYHKKHGFPLFNKFSEASKAVSLYKTHGTACVEDVFSKKGTKFKDLNIHSHTITNLERIGLTILTVVQEKAIPEIMEGKNVFIRSQTGSGKTLAYAIPIIESLRSIEPHINRKDGIQAVVIVPTRELALQTYELFLKLVEPFRWIVPGRLSGGENRNSEKARLRKGITVLIGTPGRLLDHALHSQNLKLDKVRCLVLDEADRLLDMGFQKDVNKLIELIDSSKNLDYDPIGLMKLQNNKTTFEIDSNSTNNTKKIPLLTNIHSKNRQTVLLSATLTSNVKDLATFTLTDYVYIDPLHSNPNVDINLLEQTDSGTDVAVPESVEQKFVITDVKTRLVVLSALVVAKSKEKSCKMFVFMASRPMVEFHELLFKKCLVKRPKKVKSGVRITMDEDDDEEDEDEEGVLDVEFFKLHGSMDQKQRVDVFKKFREADKGVLFCTDVAARGVDVPLADYVIQYTAPLQDQDYIHRVGRTGRAGNKGRAVLFLTEPELKYVDHLKEKHVILNRESQDKILRHLLPFMEHVGPTGSVQMAAEVLQRRFEKAVLADIHLHKAACMAYSTWSRYYSSYPKDLREFFNIKNSHLGHYVTSFALRDSPQQVGRFARTEVGKTDDVRLNKKLDNHDRVEEENIFRPLKTKKRPRDVELVVSEFDSGLPSKKKKNH